ncbi:hypothetical protein O1V64_00150 (plasmid) [Rouxiella badensis]|nr:hypothetical protein O1V64_00570 [Rouxiella badensis]WAT03268.1 hypothetical protein O1V64_00150 [Rouxiella badensis]
MTVKDFSQMAGAMRLLGTDSETAKNSIEGLYGTFNDGLQGRNNAVLAVMNQIHAVIYKNADGTANVLKTVESLADVLPRLSPQTQKTVTDALNLNADTLQLLREGAHLKGLLAESDAIGLTVDPKTTADLASFNRQLTEASAAWDGLKQRTVQKAAKGLLSDGSLRDTVSGFTDGATHNDAAGWGHMLGENDGPYEAVALRRMKGDKKFLAEATPQERANVGIGRMNDDLRKKYNAYYGESLTDGWQLDKEMAKNPEYFTRLNDRSNQLLLDMQLAEHPTLLPPIGAQPVDPNASSVRNNNPWNIRYAGQSGAVPAAKNFAHFQTPEEGVLAADRQLQLYTSGKSANVDHPLRTVAEIVSTASPEKDGNNTALMIKNASKELGVDPTQPLDFSNVQTRSRFLAAVFHQEGNSPYSSSNIENILTRNSNDASLLTPAAASGQAPGQMVDFKQTLSSVLKETGMKIELTVINQKTGEKQTFTGTGGSKVSAAMQFP